MNLDYQRNINQIRKIVKENQNINLKYLVQEQKYIKKN